ncbi:transposase [Cecembia lonarensis]|uniref:Transposase n=1 Tax=Cecembia lonarensis (strain CCUG 58316 / KCTC 22772 / LW9) TaxID=1225176 RepID=K1L172_CECL9|nr:transposase [Cecembia lonarensis]EKB48516.1 Transposase [Cecembia lonarensis LW9]
MTDIFEPEGIYHIYNKANGDEKLFKSDDNYFYFLEKFNTYLGNKVGTLAYCLIPNHYHFLVKVNSDISDEQLVKAFSDFQNSYSKSYNKVFSRNGSLFQRKFKRKKIKSEEYLTRIIIYIHQNPVKHQLTKGPFEWRFSSFQAYLSDRSSKVSRELALEWFGGLEGFRIAHQENVEKYLPEDLLME